MAVSVKRHNEEAAESPVDKKKLVDMQENHSKIEEKLNNQRISKKNIAWKERASRFCVSITLSG
jgi:hypothetical protein